MAVLFGHHYRADTADVSAARVRVEQHIHSHRGWYFLQGSVFLIFGLIAAILPGITAVSAALFIGAMLLVTGIFQLIASFQSRLYRWSFLSALLSIFMGAWMLWAPMAGTLALAVALAIFLAAEGALEILLALEFRATRNWGWMLASGIATLILSALLWSGFPVLSAVYLGMLIAVNFIFYGVSLLMLAASVRR